MKITFLGAVEQVTGSRYLIETEDKKILVDCGMFQEGHKQLNARNIEPFFINPSMIDAVVLTHAHVDHSGYIPALVKQGFHGPIYCSQATYALCSLLLVDSGSIQESDAKERNKKAHNNDAVPLYTKEDAQKSLHFFQVVDYDSVVNIGTSLKVTLIRSHHIIGSSFVIISDGKKTLTFSGDLGRPDQLIMKDPTHLKHTDFLVIESTYGDKVHEKGDPIEALGEVILEAMAKGGMLIIPTFAVERAQLILYGIYQLKQKKIIPDIPVFLDSPLGIGVTELFCNFPEELSLSFSLCSKILDVAQSTRTVEESKAIDNIHYPAIIIAGSGMADGGRVLYHFKRFIANPKNTVVFVGYQVKGTLGYDLVSGAKQIAIDDTWYPVFADIKIINTFSAHADSSEILQWLGYFENNPKKVFVTHGDLEAAQVLKKRIEERFGWSVVIPKYLQAFELD